MTSEDILRSINSQMLMVFFLPLVLAGLHLVFAFPFIHKLLLLFNISNLPLLLMTTGISFLMFAVRYILAYRMTSNTYYQLVNGRHREDSRFQID